MRADLEQRIRVHLGDDLLAACKRGDQAAIDMIAATLGIDDANEVTASVVPPVTPQVSEHGD